MAPRTVCIDQPTVMELHRELYVTSEALVMAAKTFLAWSSVDGASVMLPAMKKIDNMKVVKTNEFELRICE